MLHHLSLAPGVILKTSVLVLLLLLVVSVVTIVHAQTPLYTATAYASAGGYTWQMAYHPGRNILDNKTNSIFFTTHIGCWIKATSDMTLSGPVTYRAIAGSGSCAAASATEVAPLSASFNDVWGLTPYHHFAAIGLTRPRYHGDLYWEGFFVSDVSNCVMRFLNFRRAGAVTTVAGTSGSPGYLNGQGAAATFGQPQEIWGGVLALATPTWMVLIADFSNYCIRQGTPVNTMTSGVLTLQNMQLNVGGFLGSCGTDLAVPYASGYNSLIHTPTGIAFVKGFSSVGSSLGFFTDTVGMYQISPIYPSRFVTYLYGTTWNIQTFAMVFQHNYASLPNLVTVDLIFPLIPTTTNIMTMYWLRMNFTNAGTSINAGSNSMFQALGPVSGQQVMYLAFVATDQGAKMVVGMSGGVGVYCCLDAAYAVDPVFPTMSVMSMSKTRLVTASPTVSRTVLATRSKTHLTSPTETYSLTTSSTPSGSPTSSASRSSTRTLSDTRSDSRSATATPVASKSVTSTSTRSASPGPRTGTTSVSVSMSVSVTTPRSRSTSVVSTKSTSVSITAIVTVTQPINLTSTRSRSISVIPAVSTPFCAATAGNHSTYLPATLGDCCGALEVNAAGGLACNCTSSLIACIGTHAQLDASRNATMWVHNCTAPYLSCMVTAAFSITPVAASNRLCPFAAQLQREVLDAFSSSSSFFGTALFQSCIAAVRNVSLGLIGSLHTHPLLQSSDLSALQASLCSEPSTASEAALRRALNISGSSIEVGKTAVALLGVIKLQSASEEDGCDVCDSASLAPLVDANARLNGMVVLEMEARKVGASTALQQAARGGCDFGCPPERPYRTSVPGLVNPAAMSAPLYDQCRRGPFNMTICSDIPDIGLFAGPAVARSSRQSAQTFPCQPHPVTGTCQCPVGTAEFTFPVARWDSNNVGVVIPVNVSLCLKGADAFIMVIPGGRGERTALFNSVSSEAVDASTTFDLLDPPVGARCIPAANRTGACTCVYNASRPESLRMLTAAPILHYDVDERTYSPGVLFVCWGGSVRVDSGAPLSAPSTVVSIIAGIIGGPAAAALQAADLISSIDCVNLQRRQVSARKAAAVPYRIGDSELGGIYFLMCFVGGIIVLQAVAVMGFGIKRLRESRPTTTTRLEIMIAVCAKLRFPGVTMRVWLLCFQGMMFESARILAGLGGYGVVLQGGELYLVIQMVIWCTAVFFGVAFVGYLAGKLASQEEGSTSTAVELVAQPVATEEPPKPQVELPNPLAAASPESNNHSGSDELGEGVLQTDVTSVSPAVVNLPQCPFVEYSEAALSGVPSPVAAVFAPGYWSTATHRYNGMWDLTYSGFKPRAIARAAGMLQMIQAVLVAAFVVPPSNLYQCIAFFSTLAACLFALAITVFVTQPFRWVLDSCITGVMLVLTGMIALSTALPTSLGVAKLGFSMALTVVAVISVCVSVLQTILELIMQRRQTANEESEMPLSVEAQLEKRQDDEKDVTVTPRPVSAGDNAVMPVVDPCDLHAIVGEDSCVCPVRPTAGNPDVHMEATLIDV